jgi:uncharacterized protein YdaU (DUF1376 family)
MADQPFLPFFVGDFLGATVTWEGEERALYMLMLAYQWSGGALPANLEKLSRTLGYPHGKFITLWETVQVKFVNRKGSLYNERLEYHRARTVEISHARSSAGSIGGRASAAKRAAQAQAKKESPDMANREATVQANVEATVETSLGKYQANVEAKRQQNSTILSYPILSDPIQKTHTHTGPDAGAGGHRKGREGEPGASLSEAPVLDSAPFEREIMAKYPKGPNPPNWPGAIMHAGSLVSSGLATWPELLQCVERYARYVESGTANVNIAAHNFFDRRKGNYWQQQWTDLPVSNGAGRRKTYDDYDRESAARLAQLPGEDPGPL